MGQITLTLRERTRPLYAVVQPQSSREAQEQGGLTRATERGPEMSRSVYLCSSSPKENTWDWRNTNTSTNTW